MKKTIVRGFIVLSISLVSSFALAQFGNPDLGKAKANTCFTCHGNNGHSKNPMYPVLAGQKADVLFTKMMGYKKGTIKTANAPTMKPWMEPLSEQEMKDLAAFFESVKPEEPSSRRRRQ